MALFKSEKFPTFNLQFSVSKSIKYQNKVSLKMNNIFVMNKGQEIQGVSLKLWNGKEMKKDWLMNTKSSNAQFSVSDFD
jgi:hypothetical protein